MHFSYSILWCLGTFQKHMHTIMHAYGHIYYVSFTLTANKYLHAICTCMRSISMYFCLACSSVKNLQLPSALYAIKLLFLLGKF